MLKYLLVVYKKMFTLKCKDLEVPNCLYEAKAFTEDEVILLMMEHIMKTHPKEVKEFMSTMNRENIAEMMREKIQREVDLG